jgi:hypothetical protein
MPAAHIMLARCSLCSHTDLGSIPALLPSCMSMGQLPSLSELHKGRSCLGLFIASPGQPWPVGQASFQKYNCKINTSTSGPRQAMPPLQRGPGQLRRLGTGLTRGWLLTSHTLTATHPHASVVTPAPTSLQPCPKRPRTAWLTVRHSFQGRGPGLGRVRPCEFMLEVGMYHPERLCDRRSLCQECRL